MGKILSTVLRPVRDFNLESRAHKIIAKDKPIPAPKHKSNEKQYAQLVKEQLSIEETVKKNENLNKYLRDVYVTSQDETTKPAPDPLKPLPVDRKIVEETMLGYVEPKKVPYGRVTLKTALKFISQHQTDAGVHTINKIAETHKLPEQKVKNIVNYFRVFELYEPENKIKSQFLGPIRPQKQVVTVKRKKLPSNTSQN